LAFSLLFHNDGVLQPILAGRPHFNVNNAPKRHTGAIMATDPSIAKLANVFRKIAFAGLDPNSHIGSLVAAGIERNIESYVATTSEKMDAADILKLETWRDHFVAIYMACPPTARVFASRTFAQSVKKRYPELKDGSPAFALLEAMDQANPATERLMNDANLKPEDFAAALKAKTIGTVTDIINNFKEHILSNPHDPPKDEGHAPKSDTSNTPTAAIVPAKLDPYLIIATDWDPEVAKLFYALQDGAEEENNGNPKWSDGTNKQEDERPWLGQANGFMRGLNRNLATSDGLVRLEKIFTRLHANHVTAADLEQNPFFHAKVAIQAIVGRKDPFSAANLFDHADQTLSLSKWGGRLAGTEVVVIKDENGNVLKQRPSRWRHLKWPTILLLLVVLSVPVVGVVGFGWSATKILSIAADQTGPVAADITEKLRTPMKWQTIGLVLILLTRLLLTPLLDLPFQGGGWLAHKLKVKESDTPTTPAFDLGTLITAVSGGLCMLMLGIGGLTIWGGGSAHSSMLACLIIADLVFWGEMLKRFRHGEWPSERHGDHPLTGDERKLHDGWWRYMVGLTLSTAALLVFIVAIPIDGYLTKQERNAITVSKLECENVKTTLTALSKQWNKSHAQEEDTEFIVMCTVDGTKSQLLHELCENQKKLCR